MTPFEPDGVYAGIPYRVLPDNSIEAMLPGGLVKFKDMRHLLASAGDGRANVDAGRPAPSNDLLPGTGEAPVPLPVQPPDYYSVLLETINRTKQNSAQLRALVYERARFNLKRDILFGHSTLGLADLVEKVNEFEMAVARIEANAVDEPPAPVYRQRLESAGVSAEDSSSKVVQILPPRPLASLYAGLASLQALETFWRERRPKDVWPYHIEPNQVIRFTLAAVIAIGIVAAAAALWHFRTSGPLEAANKPPQVSDSATKRAPSEEKPVAADVTPPAPPFPLPTSFGIYLLSGDKLVELQPLPTNVPDRRVAVSAPINKPSTTVIADDKPAFILFRRDLQNNAPQTVSLRVIARVTRATKIVNRKATSVNVEGSWRIRNISHVLKVSPVPGQREMVMARVEDESLPAGRYALVLNQTGYDFTVDGPTKSRDFCLEEFEAASGSMLNECRDP
ncbi:MAG TPA: hypothetical protein VMI47_09080 [Pseudolabrys sp.]|nr:hypothetical protein [Pseudolabrys sp.]